MRQPSKTKYKLKIDQAFLILDMDEGKYSFSMNNCDVGTFQHWGKKGEDVHLPEKDNKSKINSSGRKGMAVLDQHVKFLEANYSVAVALIWERQT